MADMDVVWKRRSNLTWLWILITLIVIGALWFVFSGRSFRSTSAGQLTVPPAGWLQLAGPVQTIERPMGGKT